MKLSSTPHSVVWGAERNKNQTEQNLSTVHPVFQGLQRGEDCQTAAEATNISKGCVVYRKEDKNAVVSISALRQNYTLFSSPSELLKITNKTTSRRGGFKSHSVVKRGRWATEEPGQDGRSISNKDTGEQHKPNCSCLTSGRKCSLGEWLKS